MRRLILCSLLAFVSMLVSGCASPADGTVSTPITHQSWWVQEGEQFGYAPEYAPGVISFDAANRPYVFQEQRILTPDDAGNWLHLDFTEAVKAAYPEWNGQMQQGDFSESHIVFDDQDVAWIVVNACRSNIKQLLLLYSRDHCRSWTVVPVTPGDSRTFAKIEYRDSFNEIPGPPTVLFGRPSAGGTMGIMMAAPRWQDDGRLAIGELLPVTDDGYLIPVHSGGGNMVVSRQGKSHIFWAASTPVSGHETDGTPTYGRTFDHATRTFTEPVFLGYGGFGKPDNHNLPAAVFDGTGTIHLLLGAHHDPFLYRHTLAPDSIAQWTDPVPVGEAREGSGGSYTYVGFVCTPDGTLHSVARWAGDGYFFRLVHQSKPAGGDWQPHQVLVSPFKNMYSCWYHKLVVDRRGRLFCNYILFTAQLSHEQTAAFCYKFPSERNHWDSGARGKRGACLLVSDDGKQWHLAEPTDLTGKAAPRAPQPPSPPLAVQPTRRIEAQSQLGGGVQAIVADGDRFIAAMGSRLVALSSEVEILSQSALVEGELRAVAVHGDVIYACTSTRLFAFSKQDAPWRPLVSLAVPGDASRLLVIGASLYVMSCDGGLTVVDITTPAAPVLARRLPGHPVYDMAVHGDLAYVACGNDGLRIWDISAPGTPVEVAAQPGNADQRWSGSFGVTVAGEHLYVGPAPSDVPLRVLSLANPLAPQEVARVEANQWSWGRKVLVLGDRLYYPGPKQLLTFDISNPSQPKLLHETLVSGNLRGLTIIGESLVAPSGSTGLMVFDRTQADRTVLRSVYAEPVCAWGITADGLLTDWYSGLHVLAGAMPQSVGLLPKPQPGRNERFLSRFRAARQGDLAYLAAADEGLITVDLTDPATPREQARQTYEGGIRDVVIAGDWLYLAEEGQGIRILSTRDAATGTLLPQDREIQALTSANGLLVTATSLWNGRARITVYTGAEQGLLQPVGQFDTAADTYGMDIGPTGTLYLAQAQHGIAVVDLSNPAVPRILERLALGAPACDVAVTTDGLSVACGQAGLLSYPLEQ